MYRICRLINYYHCYSNNYTFVFTLIFELRLIPPYPPKLTSNCLDSPHQGIYIFQVPHTPCDTSSASSLVCQGGDGHRRGKGPFQSLVGIQYLPLHFLSDCVGGHEWPGRSISLGFGGSRIRFAGISWCPWASHFMSQSLFVFIC